VERCSSLVGGTERAAQKDTKLRLTWLSIDFAAGQRPVVVQPGCTSDTLFLLRASAVAVCIRSSQRRPCRTCQPPIRIHPSTRPRTSPLPLARSGKQSGSRFEAATRCKHKVNLCSVICRELCKSRARSRVVLHYIVWPSGTLLPPMQSSGNSECSLELPCRTHFPDLQ
jgi:hypothetical protein